MWTPSIDKCLLISVGPREALYSYMMSKKYWGNYEVYSHTNESTPIKNQMSGIRDWLDIIYRQISQKFPLWNSWYVKSTCTIQQ